MDFGISTLVDFTWKATLALVLECYEPTLLE
jgi:hypothetical protein